MSCHSKNVVSTFTSDLASEENPKAKDALGCLKLILTAQQLRPFLPVHEATQAVFRPEDTGEFFSETVLQ